METDSWQKVGLWASFIFFLGAALLRQEAGINQDLGRHLRLGEMIVSGGEDRRCALFTNCLTYTYPDYPFVNHHWGSEIIFYFIYKLGGFGALIMFKALILGTAFAITVIHASQVQKTQEIGKTVKQYDGKTVVGKSVTSSPVSPSTGLPTYRSTDYRSTVLPLHRFTDASLSLPSALKLSIAMILTFLSINMMADRLTTRPEIFGYLLFSLLFWILNKSYIDDKRPARLNALAFGGSLLIYITPAIILLWVNLHISFVFGVIMVWIWSGAKILNTEFRILNDKSKNVKQTPIQYSVFSIRYLRILTIPTVSTLATIFNPAGLRGVLMPLSIMKDYGYTIVENMTPFFLRAFKPQPEYWIYTLLLLLTTFLLITSPKRPSLFSILTFYAFAIFPLIAVRHLPFFALVIPVVLAPLTRSLPDVHRGDSWSISEKFAKLLTLISGSLLIAALTNPAPLAYAKLPGLGLAADRRHEEAVKFVKEHDLQGKMWNNYDIGSYLEWAIPEHPTFVDGRPEAFPAGFFQETYIPMQESRQKWDEVVEKYDIQWVFAALTDATPWFGKWRQMIGRHQEWKVVYSDRTTAIYVKL